MATFLLWISVLGLSLVGDTATAASDSSDGSRKLDQTPTWAVASVCTVIIVISILLEKIIHKLHTVFTEKHKRALVEALEKVKAELMILGFISLLLTFCQSYIVKICIPIKAANTMLPCKAKIKEAEEHRRRLLWSGHRILAAEAGSKCSEGHEPIITIDGLHQLHILIFFLAVLHVLYSFATMMLGRLKIRGWKQWEEETSSHDYEFSNDPSRFRLTNQTSFVKAHSSFWTRIPIFFCIGCFFRQFFRSVKKTDYMTLRNGFIAVHLAPGSKFNFQKYIKRSLEDDFKLVVGVSPVLWASFVIFFLLNVDGWQALFWASLIPIVIILAVGTKLQAILTKMALEITERHAVVQGIPLVQASDEYFWFSWPQLLLHLIHFALFQNAFQITYFLWIWYEYGLKSCFHANFTVAIIKVALGFGAMILCSYITLPLYALVTQMGTHMKRSIFDEQTSKALKKWRDAAKKKQGKGSKSPARILGVAGSPSASPVHPSGHTLHRFRTTGHSNRSQPLDSYEDNSSSDLEADPSSHKLSSTTSLLIRVDDQDDQQNGAHHNPHDEHTANEDDFSFSKMAPQREA